MREKFVQKIRKMVVQYHLSSVKINNKDMN